MPVQNGSDPRSAFFGRCCRGITHIFQSFGVGIIARVQFLYDGLVEYSVPMTEQILQYFVLLRGIVGGILRFGHGINWEKPRTEYCVHMHWQPLSTIT